MNNAASNANYFLGVTTGTNETTNAMEAKTMNQI